MNKFTGLESIEADLLFVPLTAIDLRPIATLKPHPEEVIIRRDNNFKIKLEMKGKVSNPGELDNDRKIQLGTVIEAESTEGKGRYGATNIYFRGISAGQWSVNSFSGEFILYGAAGRVIEEYGSSAGVNSSIIYLLGFPTDMAPRMTERNSSGEVVLNRPDIPEMGSAQTITKPAIGNSLSSGRDCILIKNKHAICLFSKGAKNELSEHFSPSYLHFVKGDVVKSENARRSFLEALCFTFGKRFVDVGDTDLDENNYPIKRSSRTPYSVNIHAEVFSHELPPTCMLEGYGFISEQAVSEIIDLFLDAMDKFNLSDVMWNIWTARMMPIGLELVAYAAALEALINAWFENVKKSDRSFYVPASEFKKYASPHITTLRTEAPGTLPWKRLIDRMDSSNQLSISDKYRRFFEELGLEVGKVENAVILSRHKFAHGGSFEDDEVKRLIHIARAYEALLNRCVLKVIGFRGKYRDYSTLGFPERMIEEALGGPNNDGEI